jgi:hypothetical protein
MRRYALILAGLLAGAVAQADELLDQRHPADDLLNQLRHADDAIATSLQRLLAGALQGDRETVGQQLAVLVETEAQRRAAKQPPTGLLDDARYLAAAIEPTRDARRAALEALADQSLDPLVERQVETRLETDDGFAADQLLTDDRHNRRATLVNDAIRPLGIFSGAIFVAAVNPFLLAGSAIDSVATTAINLWNYNHLSAPEREALVRYRRLLRRSPDTVDATTIRQAVRELGEKRANALCERALDDGDAALDADDVDHARYHLRSALEADGCRTKAEKLQAKVTAAASTRAKQEEDGQWPVDDPAHPAAGPEAADYEALAVAIAAGSAEEAADAARRFLARHPASAFATSARFSLAVAQDQGGKHAEARDALAEVADDDDRALGRRVAALLESPEFNRLDAIRAAERRHSLEVAKFVLVGEGLDSRSALYTASQFGAASVQAAESFGIFNVIGILTRAWQAWRTDPASNQDIIDRGEEFLARAPDAPEAADVHERLAQAYERALNYSRALMHVYALPTRDQARLDKLEGKLADQLLADAEKSHNDPVVLRGLVRHFGRTDAAATARERLEGMPESAATQLDRDLLQDNPELLGPSALDLDPRLLDGDPKNGELADAGITLRGGELRLTLRDGRSGTRTEARPLSPEAFARATGAAEEVLYRNLLTTDRRGADEGRYERYIPFFLQGSLDDSGAIAVAPGVKLRRYKSTDAGLYGE